MKILVLGGAGAMGMVTVRDLAESPHVSEVVIGDSNIEKAKQVAKWAGSEKVSIQKIDATNLESLVEVVKQVDAVANALPYHLNLQVTEAALKAKRNLTDLGGVYYMTLRQLELDKKAKEANITIVLGCGVAPGIADVLAKFGADKLDIVKEVHIRYGEVNLEPAKYKWTFRTVFEEYTQGPVVYQDGEFKKLPPFSGKHVVKFPHPIGERPCCYALYSGIATLPFTINKGVRTVDCAMSYSEEDEQRIKVLTEMGLAKTEPVVLGETAISPREFLFHVAPPPDVNVKDVAGILVEVIGEADGKTAKYTYTLVHPFQEKYGVSALAYLTGVPLSIVSQMLAKDSIKEKGVLPPEAALKPKPFFSELAKRDIKIQETFERTQSLQEVL
ncbi:MAG: saccharopine dehydrogenase C-terminal domain-containing protein [Candidatus Bathyarchaeia archaeon]